MDPVPALVFQQAFASIVSVLVREVIGDPRVDKASQDLFVQVASQPSSPSDLQKSIGLPYREFSKLVELMIDANVLAMTGESGEERVDLSSGAKKILAEVGNAAAGS